MTSAAGHSQNLTLEDPEPLAQDAWDEMSGDHAAPRATVDVRYAARQVVELPHIRPLRLRLLLHLAVMAAVRPTHCGHSPASCCNTAHPHRHPSLGSRGLDCYITSHHTLAHHTLAHLSPHPRSPVTTLSLTHSLTSHHTLAYLSPHTRSHLTTHSLTSHHYTLDLSPLADCGMQL